MVAFTIDEQSFHHVPEGVPVFERVPGSRLELGSSARKTLTDHTFVHGAALKPDRELQLRHAFTARAVTAHGDFPRRRVGPLSTFTLYTTPLSANGRKVLAVSQHLGLEPEIRLVNVYQGEGRSAEYLKINPSGKIPTLVDGEFTLFESNAILQYLSEAHGKYRLWSREPKERAAIARWLFWEAAHWQPVLTALLSSFVGHRLLPALVAAPTADVDWENEHLAALLHTLESSLRAHPFLHGDALTIADLCVAGMMTYFRVANFPFRKTPDLAAWYARIEALEAWRSTEASIFREHTL